MSLRNFFLRSGLTRLCRCETFRAECLTHCVVARLFVRSDFTHCIVARFICVAVSRCLLLRNFFCAAVSRGCVVERLFVRSVSRSVSLQIFLRSGLTHYVVVKLFCEAISRVVSLRVFFAKRSLALHRCEAFLAEQSHALCHCEIFLRSVSCVVLLRDFLRSDFTHCAVARFICVAVSRCLLLRGFLCGASHALCRCEAFVCRAVSRGYVVTRLFLRSVSRSVLLRVFFAYHSKTYYLSPIIKYPFAYLSQPF